VDGLLDEGVCPGAEGLARLVLADERKRTSRKAVREGLSIRSKGKRRTAGWESILDMER
jgi:hypothetical protein